jgi:hypothetical protein
MLSETSRRDFLKNCGQLGLACTAACGLHSVASAADQGTAPVAPPKLPELHTRAYCGLICDDSCQLFRATRTNDAAAKRKVYDEWGWKTKFGMEFDPEKVFCYGCKSPGKPRSPAKAKCTVRACAIDRDLDCCIACKRLAACDKELWKNYADFKKQMVALQQPYVAAGAVTLID